MASAKRYGPRDGKGRITVEDYHQSKDALRGLPETTAERVPVTSTPNVFSYKAYVFAKDPALVARVIKSTKAEINVDFPLERGPVTSTRPSASAHSPWISRERPSCSAEIARAGIMRKMPPAPR